MSTAPDDEFLAVAQQAMRGPGEDALDALGWWELLHQLDDDADARSAIVAVFRAQGRELAGTPALGGLIAAPYLEGSALAPGAAIAAVRRHSLRHGPVWVVVGDPGTRHVLFDDPERGVFVAEPDALDVRPVEIPGHAAVHEVTIDLSMHEVWSTATPLDVLRTRSLYLGRAALAAEILGTAERAVDLAVQYASDREQFGQPIGTFQAVRHLLAWARTDCVALEAVVRTAVDVLADPPARYGEVVKALAGRNGRRACQRSLQVLGGIGFTAEHPHHHHYSRVLALDSVLGTSAELTADLGGWLRNEATDPGFARRVMHPTLETDS